MKSKTFVIMFVAIGCGLVAAYLTARITAKQAAPDTVPVLVAKEKIKAGEVIKDPEKVFVEMRYPTGSTPNAISSLEDLAACRASGAAGVIVGRALYEGAIDLPAALRAFPAPV